MDSWAFKGYRDGFLEMLKEAQGAAPKAPQVPDMDPVEQAPAPAQAPAKASPQAPAAKGYPGAQPGPDFGPTRAGSSLRMPEGPRQRLHREYAEVAPGMGHPGRTPRWGPSADDPHGWTQPYKPMQVNPTTQRMFESEWSRAGHGYAPEVGHANTELFQRWARSRDPRGVYPQADVFQY